MSATTSTQASPAPSPGREVDRTPTEDGLPNARSAHLAEPLLPGLKRKLSTVEQGELGGDVRRLEEFSRASISVSPSRALNSAHAGRTCPSSKCWTASTVLILDRRNFYLLSPIVPNSGATTFRISSLRRPLQNDVPPSRHQQILSSRPPPAPTSLPSMMSSAPPSRLPPLLPAPPGKRARRVRRVRCTSLQT